MPKVTGNDLVVQTLQREGVDTVFYLTGGPMSDVAALCTVANFFIVGGAGERRLTTAGESFIQCTNVFYLQSFLEKGSAARPPSPQLYWARTLNSHYGLPWEGELVDIPGARRPDLKSMRMTFTTGDW